MRPPRAIAIVRSTSALENVDKPGMGKPTTDVGGSNARAEPPNYASAHSQVHTGTRASVYLGKEHRDLEAGADVSLRDY